MLSFFLKTHPWAYPTLESLHIFGIALLLGNLVALEVRVFGGARALPVLPFARLSLTLALVGFALAGSTGALMFSTRVDDLLQHRVFFAKLTLIALAGLNAVVFHLRRSLQRLDAVARGQVVLSTLIWLAVVFCGRWLAY